MDDTLTLVLSIWGDTKSRTTCLGELALFLLVSISLDAFLPECLVVI